MIVIFLCITLIVVLLYFILFDKMENFSNNDKNVFGFNPYIYPAYEQVQDKMTLPVKHGVTGNIHKWEKRFPHLVNQRYSMNDRYPDNCDNGDYIFKESTYDLADKALLTDLPLKLKSTWTDKDFVNSNELYNESDVCSININNFDEKYKNYGPFISKEKDIKYNAYEPTYFDYLDVIY